MPEAASIVLKEIASLEPAEFALNLPALKKITEQPVRQVMVTPGTVQQVAANLRQTQPNTPEYWPSLLGFLRFSSLLASPDVPAPGKPNLVFSHNINLSFSPVKNAIVQLDGGDLINTTFTNSRIMFTEDPVRMQNVTFVNCVFEFPVSSQPSLYIQRAAQVLLAEDIQRIVVRSL